MAPARLSLREEDIVRLALEFLNNRELHISQLSLERETGVINGQYSDDVLFLRQLILDGQWDDVVEFIQPLEALQNFDMKQFKYSILRHKYIELLCIKSEAGGLAAGPPLINNVEGAVEEVVQVLGELEKLCPTKEEYSGLCLLLTLPKLGDHLQYRDWNPSKARVQCFREIFPLVEKFLPGDKKLGSAGGAGGGGGLASAKNDRLVQLLIKGVLYESCVNYCQVKATGAADAASQKINFSRVLDGSIGFTDSDLSLLSWLQSIPADTFSVPFEQKTLNVDVERLEKPSLETSWTEHMLITPIKPKTFPHSVMPFTRPRSAADIMTRSLLPSLDAVSSCLNPKAPNESFPMSRSSFASFHLTGIKPSSGKLMTSSVDRLFENGDGGEAYRSSNFAEYQQGLPSIDEIASVQSKSPDLQAVAGAVVKACDIHQNSAERDSPNTTSSTAKSSRRDSLSEKITTTQQPVPTGLPHHSQPHSVPASAISTPGSTAGPNSANSPVPLIPPPGVPHPPIVAGAIYDQPKPTAKPGHNPPAVHNYNGATNGNSSNSGAGGGELYEKFKQQKQNKESDYIMNGNPTIVPPAHMNNTAPSPAPPPVQTNGNGMPPVVMGAHPSEDIIGNRDFEQSDQNRPRFVAVTTLEDVQAVRCAEFHPNGRIYAVGSNSKTFRICEYPSLSEIREDHSTYQPTVLFKRTKHHKGSIYCMAWSPAGDLIATGSNDKTVKLMRFSESQKQLEGQEIELTMHDGTVRDLCFLEDSSNKSSLLISGGAGDCKIYVTDCETSTPFQALSGHGGHVLSLYNWGGVMFVSGSQDKTVRFWDLRTRGCVNMVTPATSPGSRQGSPVAAVCVDPSGRLLVSGHEDSSCVLYDIRGNRPIQCFKPHSADVRSIRFSPSAYYLLTAGYDNKLVLTDLQGDLTMPLPSVVVAQHTDKVISGRWHPVDFSFLSTSADKTATLWALPPI
ncbi:WD repeat-containing protein 47 [Anopheles ziemanni]|uniref:WD repeat-containing protein 47 n=1 Tax=Anopheles ziemanni TaxID=345580 RepID=UPI00265A018C|nr:WD repeat-containing protein 47 isoform X1 [Anopheles coustani]XP_058175805.1 WD repeat-containing protein 47 [Anopheles ziemanni]